MIHGSFGSRGQLFFEIELITAHGLNLPIDAMLDTGFTGFLAVNKQDLDGLDWAYISRDKLQTAKGEGKFEIYLGKVLLDGTEYDIPVYSGNRITEVLLGSEWLTILPLVSNYPAGVLTLG